MYFDSDYASVEWNSAVNVAVLKWKKFATGSDFRIPSQKTLELAISKRATKWYSDTTLLGVLKPEDTDWFIKEIVQGMLKNGIKKQALIVPQKVIAQMSLNKAGSQAEDIGLETKFFSSPQEALNWL